MTGQCIQITRRRLAGGEDLRVPFGETTATFPFQCPHYDSRPAAGMLCPDFVINKSDDLVR